MKIAVAQIATDPGKIRENAEKIKDYVQQARAAGAELVVFPELSLPGYGHMDLVLQKAFTDAVRNALYKIAEVSDGITVVVGFVDRDDTAVGPGRKPVLYNSAALLRDGALRAVIDKTLLPTYDIFSELRYFTPGRRQGIVEVGGRRLGIGICEDLWDEGYGIRVYPALADQHPDLLINISASPFAVGKLHERKALIQRAMNGSGVPFVYANLVGCFDGYDGEIAFDGRSLMINSAGQLAALGKAFEEELLLLDTEAAPAVQVPPENPSQELHGALVLGIREYFRRTSFERAYIGLSGGIDSALVAALAAEALGSDNVIGVTMPSHITSSETRADALRLAENLNIRCDVRPIGGEYKAWEDDFRQALGREPRPITKQNKQARIRGSILMEYTNEDPKGLVISTGNKTELACGYCTLYGDMAGGFAAISDLSKARVYQVAEYINSSAGMEIIPASIIKRIPTAELEHGQTDAANLPADYDVLSPLVDAIIDEQCPYDELCRRYGTDVVDRTLRLVHANEFKRRQAAPGIRVTNKAFGIGRRFPIVHGFWRNSAKLS